MNAISTAEKTVSYGFAAAIATAIVAHEFQGISINGVNLTAEQLLKGEMVAGKNGRNYNNRSFLRSLPHSVGQAIIDYVNALPKKVKAPASNVVPNFVVSVPTAVEVPAVAAPVVAPVVSADAQAVVDHVHRAEPKNAGLNDGSSEIEILVNRAIAVALAQHGILERPAPEPGYSMVNVVESPNVDQVVATVKLGQPIEILGENGEKLNKWFIPKGFTDARGSLKGKTFSAPPE